MSPSELNPGTVLAGLLGVANIGGAVYLVKLVIAPLAQSVKTLSQSVKELYDSRDQLRTNVTEIQTIHKLKGCDAPVQQKDLRL